MLLERDAELATLDAAFSDCQEGAGRLTVIEGPPGIGKSSIVAEARTRAASAGFHVLRARGSELEAAFSYGVVRQLFEAVLMPAEESLRVEVFSGAAARASRLFDAESDVPPADDATDFAMVHGLYWLTVNDAGRSLVI